MLTTIKQANKKMNVKNVIEKKHVDELLQGQARVWNLLFNFINSMSLKCAIDLGIPDIIHNHGKPMTISELVASLPINATKACNIYRLMRILVHSGIFAPQKVGENDGEEGYVLTSASMLLFQNEPLSVTPFLKAMLDPALTNSWHFLSAWFQNDDPTPFYTAHKRKLWEYCGHDPKLGRLFDEGMASDTRLVSSILINESKGLFEGLNSLVDVGGGIGTMAKAIANAFPHLECMVLDLPHVVNGLQGCGNLKYVGGDLFEKIPPADAVLLKWMLHAWSDEECVKILTRSKEAIFSRKDKQGKVIIIDMVLKENTQKMNGDENESSTETQLFFDMMMMALVTGRERSEKEWAELFSVAGFSDYKITPILGLRSIIEVYP